MSPSLEGLFMRAKVDTACAVERPGLVDLSYCIHQDGRECQYLCSLEGNIQPDGVLLGLPINGKYPRLIEP